MSQAVSDEVDQEPTQTKTLQNTYARKLRVLFRKLNRQLKNWVEDKRENSLFVELEPADFDLSRFQELIEELEEKVVIGPGKDIVNKYAESSYRQGIKYAETKLPGKPSGQLGPADWRAIDSLKVRNLSALKGISKETSKQVVQEVSKGIRQGDNPREIAKRINDRVEKIGITRANIMARTETIYAFNDAAEQRYTQRGYEKWQWYTAKDERVCPQCGPKHKQVYKFDSNADRPPLHSNCRCSMLPYDDEED